MVGQRVTCDDSEYCFVGTLHESGSTRVTLCCRCLEFLGRPGLLGLFLSLRVLLDLHGGRYYGVAKLPVGCSELRPV